MRMNITSPFGYQKHEKKNLQPRFFHRVVPYLSNNILLATEYKTTIKSLHSEAVSQSISSQVHDCVLQTSSSQIAAEEANLPRPYRPSVSSSVHHFVAPSISIVRG